MLYTNAAIEPNGRTEQITTNDERNNERNGTANSPKGRLKTASSGKFPIPYRNGEWASKPPNSVPRAQASAKSPTAAPAATLGAMPNFDPDLW